MLPDLDGVPLFDRAQALELLEQDGELLEEVLDIFLSSTGGLLAELCSEVEGENAEEVTCLAHSIKGGAASVCAERIRVLAHVLEELGNEGDTEAFAEIYKALEDEYHRFEAEAEQIA